MTASADVLAKWAASLRGCTRVVLADELETAPADAEL